MRLSRADLIALLIALGAAVTGLVAWNHGTVDLGLTLQSDGERVWVLDVTPGGNAERNGFYPRMSIIGLTRTDGRAVALGEPMESTPGHEDLEPVPWAYPGEAWEYSGPVPWGFDGSAEGFRLPVETVPKDLIAGVAAGEVGVEENWVYTFASMDRRWLEFSVNQSLWIAGLGLLAAAIVWRVLTHGLAGPFGRKHALVVASAVAIPGLIVPAVQVGTPAGIAAGFLAPTAVALILGLSLARHHPEPQWVQTAVAASLVGAVLAVVLVVRSLTSPNLSPGDSGTTLLMIAAIGAAPAAVAASTPSLGLRQRASFLSLGLVPASAATLMVQGLFDPIWPIILVATLIGWYVLPIERAVGLVGGGLSRVRSTAPAVPNASAAPTLVVHAPLVSAQFRDMLTLALFALVVFFGLTVQSSAAFVVLGVMLAGLVGFAVRSGFLGAHWADAAIPLGVSVGLPIAVAGFASWSYGGQMGWVSTALALVGLSVADVLAARHSDPAWRRRLL